MTDFDPAPKYEYSPDGKTVKWTNRDRMPKVAAQAGDEPMLPEPRAIRAGHSFPKVYALAYTADQMREFYRAGAVSAQVSPRATADVERNLRAELINEGALRQYCHNDGSAGFVTAYDFDITNRFLAAIATTKPGA